jgi:hypothetical protein
MRKILLIALALLSCCMLLGVMNIQGVRGAVPVTTHAVFSDLAYDGDIYQQNSNGNYTAARDAPWGYVESTQAIITVGQYYNIYSGPVYYFKIWRGFSFFDTSSIPFGANITSAFLSLYVVQDWDYEQANLTVQNGQPIYPHQPLIPTDYNYEDYNGSGGSKSTMDLTIGYYTYQFNITLNAAGISWIAEGGTTKLIVRNQRDIGNITATLSDGEVIYDSAEAGGLHSPKLYVTYTAFANVYYLYGAFNEDGSNAGAINVTFTRETESPLSFTLNNHTAPFNTTSYSTYNVFRFTIASNITRTYYTDGPVENIYVFKPKAPYSYYYFTVVDMVGVTNGYLESIITTNNTQRVVERWSIAQINNIPFLFSFGQAYQMELVCDQGTYVFGTYVASSTNQFSLTITPSMFPSTQTNTGNISISMTRPTAGNIVMSYSDSGNMTTSVNFQIYTYQNSTLAYNYTGTSESVFINWTYADPSTDYLGVITATRRIAGLASWKEALPAQSSQFNPFFLDWLAPAFKLPISQMVSIAIVLVVFVAFSAKLSELAIMTGLITAGVLIYIGWLMMSWTWFAGSFCIGIIAIVSSRKNKRADI